MWDEDDEDPDEDPEPEDGKEKKAPEYDRNQTVAKDGNRETEMMAGRRG